MMSQFANLQDFVDLADWIAHLAQRPFGGTESTAVFFTGAFALMVAVVCSWILVKKHLYKR